MDRIAQIEAKFQNGEDLTSEEVEIYVRQFPDDFEVKEIDGVMKIRLKE